MIAKRSPGERIIELCKTYSIGREVLAERSGLNIELIRRIEEEGYIPDLAPLVKIARALGVRLGTLMDDHEELGPVITRRGEAETTTRFVTGLPGNGKSGAAGSDAAKEAAEAAPSPGVPAHQGLTFKTLAAGKGGRHMEPFIVDIEPGSVQEKSTHEGEEFIHILSGKLCLEYGKNTSVLDTGDSIYYDSIVPHRVLPADNKPVRILAVIYSPA